MSTRTHTVFFNEDDLAPLRAEHERLSADARDRGRYIGADLYAKMKMRLDMLESVIILLGERAD